MSNKPFKEKNRIAGANYCDPFKYLWIPYMKDEKKREFISKNTELIIPRKAVTKDADRRAEPAAIAGR